MSERLTKIELDEIHDHLELGPPDFIVSLDTLRLLLEDWRRLRGIIAGMQGCVAYHTHCHTSEDPEDHLEPWQICGTNALDAECCAIQEEADRG